MPFRDPDSRVLSGRTGAAVRHGHDTTELRRELAEARIAAAITKVVADAPPLEPDQIDRLRVLLRPEVSTGGAA